MTRTFFRRPSLLVAMLPALLLVGVACVGLLTARSDAATAQAGAADGIAAAPADASPAALIARGAYLSRAGDCTACHTAGHGAAFAGGLAIASPMGVIYSTNITPDPQHGIGRYSEAEFADAVRKGVRRDGTRLYPAMPYPDYARISDADIHALYAYFKHGVQPVAQAAPATALTFPFNQRWGMRLWNGVFGSDRPFVASAGASAEHNRGKYLVETLGHCGSCHTPRGLGMQQKALTDDSTDFLAGGDLNGWPVPSLRGMPDWTTQDITDYLATGRNGFASVAGEMSGVVEHSMQYLGQDDLKAIAGYLKSLPADGAAHNRRADAAGAAERTTRKLAGLRGLDAGEGLYIDNCEACHWTNGKGAKGIFPRLDGNSTVLADNPIGLLSVILEGASTPSTHRAPSVMAMPGFAQRLNDQQIASLATFLRAGWGNDAKGVTERDVALVREQLVQSHAGH